MAIKINKIKCYKCKKEFYPDASKIFAFQNQIYKCPYCGNMITFCVEQDPTIFMMKKSKGWETHRFKRKPLPKSKLTKIR